MHHATVGLFQPCSTVTWPHGCASRHALIHALFLRVQPWHVKHVSCLQCSATHTDLSLCISPQGFLLGGSALTFLPPLASCPLQVEIAGSHSLASFSLVPCLLVAATGIRQSWIATSVFAFDQKDKHTLNTESLDLIGFVCISTGFSVSLALASTSLALW